MFRHRLLINTFVTWMRGKKLDGKGLGEIEIPTAIVKTGSLQYTRCTWLLMTRGGQRLPI